MITSLQIWFCGNGCMDSLDELVSWPASLGYIWALSMTCKRNIMSDDRALHINVFMYQIVGKYCWNYKVLIYSNNSKFGCCMWN